MSPHDNDAASLRAVLQDYFDGLHFSDTVRLRRAFHPDARYATATEGTLLVLNMPHYFARVADRPSPASRGEVRTDEIVQLDIAGACAFAKLKCSIAPRHFIDYLTLLKLDGRWQIISKVFHYELRDAPV